MKNRQLLIIFSATIALLAILYLAFHRKHEEELTALMVVKPWHQDVAIKKEYVAQIKAIQRIEIRSLEKGYLQKIFVDEGQFIKKGQGMFQIMPMLLEAELNKAKAEYQLAKIEYDNTVILRKKNIVSASELALAKAKLDKIHAEMELAQAHMNFATIKAPFDGIMDRFYVRLGSLINEGDLLTTLSDIRKVWVYFNVAEVDYLNYIKSHKAGEVVPVDLLLANGTMFPQKGAIDTIEGEFNNEFGNIAMRATFSNPDGILRHGETGTILLTKDYTDALVIPQKATFEILDKRFVYILNTKNELVAKQIEIEAEVPYLFVIKSGIQDSDRVLIDGIGRVTAGEVIKPRITTQEAVMKNIQPTI